MKAEEIILLFASQRHLGNCGSQNLLQRFLLFNYKLLGPYLVFLASTISGYEGTGRSLSLKLLHQLREQAAGLLKSDNNEQIVAALKGFLYCIF